MKITYQKVCCFSLIIAGFSLYPLLNYKPSVVHILKLPIDDYIPFTSIFSIPYIAYLPFIFLTIIYFVGFTDQLRKITFSFSFCMLVASLFYVFYQTTVPRPDISGNSNVFTNLVSYIYSADQPYNCFPSLHVALSLIAFLYWIKAHPNIVIPLGCFTILIILSTVFIKQHYFIDVVGGIVLGGISFLIPKKFANRYL